MPARNRSVHVVTTRRVYKDRVYETHLLRRSYREGTAPTSDMSDTHLVGSGRRRELVGRRPDSGPRNDGNGAKTHLLVLAPLSVH